MCKHGCIWGYIGKGIARFVIQWYTEAGEQTVNSSQTYLYSLGQPMGAGFSILAPVEGFFVT